MSPRTRTSDLLDVGTSRSEVTVLAAGGLEPSGRAGLFVDLETLRSQGVRACGVATCLTAQGTRTFSSAPVSPAVLSAQLRALEELGPVQAIKLGALPTRAVLTVLTRELPNDCPWVVDPVVQSSQGLALTRLRPRDYLALAGPRVHLTPNAPELSWLLSRPKPPRSLEEALAWSERLLAEGFGAVLFKGGHLAGDKAVDAVLTREGVQLLGGARLPRSARRHRGTGCRFASVVAARLACGRSVLEAARAAKAHVRAYLKR